MRAARAIAIVFLTVAGTMWWLTAPATADVPPSTATTVVPYGAGGFRYLQVAHGAGPAGFAGVSFDDSAFATGASPFGQDQFGCAITTVTAWSANTDLLVRRSVALPAGTTDVRVHVSIDNDVTLYWNGTPLAFLTHEGCPAPDDFVVSVPASLLSAGENVLAALAVDRGSTSFLDLAVTANLPPTCDSLQLSETVLWPPKHALRLVSASGGSDPEGGSLTLTVSGVTQDEPLDGIGDGKTHPDADTSGLASNEVRLRAERAGTGDGRVYRVSVTAQDAGGASCATILAVGVPHDQRSGGAIVDTADVVVDSFGLTPAAPVVHAAEPIVEPTIEPTPPTPPRAAPEASTTPIAPASAGTPRPRDPVPPVVTTTTAAPATTTTIAATPGNSGEHRAKPPRGRGSS